MTQPEVPQAVNSLRWEVQIGSDITGSADGYVNSYSAMFYVSTGGTGTYAWYSTDATNPNNPIPNNEVINVSGNNLVSWRYSIPDGVRIKFLMAAR